MPVIAAKWEAKVEGLKSRQKIAKERGKGRMGAEKRKNPLFRESIYK
jgi:hypothetical protein